MRKFWYLSLAFISTILFTIGSYSSAQADLASSENDENLAEWTILVYLNGNNNLDSFGSINMNQMEQIGSTSDVKIVVQWASLRRKSTQRILVTRDSKEKEVTSPVVQNMGKVDMGDYRTLLDFLKWGMKKYPAKRYFVDVWNHGSGWHLNQLLSRRQWNPTDISWDDNTGHSITTKQLAEVMSQASQTLGRKIDLYSSDACLMGMLEIATEMADSVSTYSGSEEVEAALGWPYHKILERLVQKPSMGSDDLGRVMVEEMIKFYEGPGSNNQDATFSTFDLEKTREMTQAMNQLSTDLLLASAEDKSKLLAAARNAQRFTYDDYVDVLDLLNQFESTQTTVIRAETFSQVRAALSSYITSHGATTSMARALGAAVWFPTTKSGFSIYSSKYNELKFTGMTQWGNALNHILN